MLNAGGNSMGTPEELILNLIITKVSYANTDKNLAGD